MKNCDICSTKCCGYDDYHGGCCSIENRNWILGGIHDAKEFMQRLQERYPHIQYSDVFVEYEEGKSLFPGNECWENPNLYPALRVNMSSAMKECVLYNKTLRRCSVYDIRPNTCRAYKCDYLKNNES